MTLSNHKNYGHIYIAIFYNAFECLKIALFPMHSSVASLKKNPKKYQRLMVYSLSGASV